MSKTLTFLLFSFCDGECFIDLLACIQDYMDTEAGSVRLPGWFNTVRNLSFGKDWPFQWLMPLRNNMLTGSHKHIRIHTCVEYIYIYTYIYMYILYIYTFIFICITQHQIPEFHSGFQGQLLQRRTTPRLPDPRIFQPNSQCVSTHGKCGIDSITEGAFQKAMGYRSPRFSHFLWNKTIFSSSSIVSGFALFFHIFPLRAD